MWGQKKWSYNMSKVFRTPKCPIKPPPWASFTNNFLIDPLGTHNLVPLKSVNTQFRPDNNDKNNK